MPGEEGAAELLRDLAVSLASAHWTEVEGAHTATCESVDVAFSVVQALTCSNMTWADPVRLAVCSEFRRLAICATEALEAAARYERETCTFANTAHAVLEKSYERSAAERARLHGAVRSLEQARIDDRQLAQARETELRDEIARLLAELGNAKRASHASCAAVEAMCVVLATDVHACEEELCVERERGNAKLERQRKIYDQQVAALHAKHGAAMMAQYVAQQRELEETKAVIARMNDSRREGAQEASTLREGILELEARYAESQRQLREHDSQLKQLLASAERQTEARLAALDEYRQREAGALTDEIKRLRMAIDEALLPCNPPPDASRGERADSKAFLRARENLFYESLKARLGVRADGVSGDANRLAATGGAEGSVSWRGQRAKLSQPRMSFGSATDTFGGFVPPEQPPPSPPTTERAKGRTSSAVHDQAAPSPRVRRARSATAALDVHGRGSYIFVTALDT